MAVKGSGRFEVFEKGNGNGGGKAALPIPTTTATTVTETQIPKPCPIPAPAPEAKHPLAHTDFTSNTSSTANKPYISSMSRAANPGTIGGSPRRPIPALPMSPEGAIKEIAWRRQGGNMTYYGYGRWVRLGRRSYAKRRLETLGVIRGYGEPDWVFEERREEEIQKMMKEGWDGRLW
ncbi:hypothetical protein IFR05_000358 [Cadophora sp. M221]|nr:hypothetical protein IFR05_000358 [Cadophora sp. M221]